MAMNLTLRPLFFNTLHAERSPKEYLSDYPMSSLRTNFLVKENYNYTVIDDILFEGRAARKTKQIQLQRGEDEEIKTAPHSFVINRGKVGRHVMSLVQNFRRVMSPFTAENLKVQKNNILKDFVSIAGPLNVSHLVMFTKSERSVNLRICRLPRGPTLHFQVNSYTLINDLAHHVRKHDVNASHFKHHALLVMNNFSKDVNHQKLTASMFQNMFPSININKVRLGRIKRIALISYEEETDTVQFRHYHIRVVPLGISRSVRKLQKKTIPKLEKYQDISQFLLNPGALSESEAEMDGEHNTVELPQNIPGSGNTQNDQSAIRLKEIGPRMTLTLTKITDGVCEGGVLYHKFDTLTDEQKEELAKRKEEKKKLKEKRKAEQNERVRLKALAKEKERVKSREVQKPQANKLNVEAEDADDIELGEETVEAEGDSADDELSDANYYEQEVGNKPDRELFSTKASKRPSKTPKGESTPQRKAPKLLNSQNASKARKAGRKKHAPQTGQFTGGAKAKGTAAKKTPNKRKRTK